MWQVIGQERIVRSLERSIAEGRLSHAYLLVGPEHVGKMTLATNLAQAMNCLSEARPCNECRSCQRIRSGIHADVQVIKRIDQAENGQSTQRKGISIDQIREMQHNISLNPYEGRYRVIIIDDANSMSEEAANALLKTLEEPPPNTVLILLAVDEGSLLPTVRSRCRKFELQPLSIEQVRQALIERKGAEPDLAGLLSRICHGCIGRALSAIEDERIIEERSSRLEQIIAISGADITRRFAFASDLATLFGKSRTNVREHLELWLMWWRDVLLTKTGCREYITNIDRIDDLERHAEQLTAGVISKAMTSIRQTMQQLDLNANPLLALEVLMLELPTIRYEGEAAHA